MVVFRYLEKVWWGARPFQRFAFAGGLAAGGYVYKQWLHLQRDRQRQAARDSQDVVYFDFAINGVYAGRVTVGLLSSAMPLTIENFKSLVEGVIVSRKEAEFAREHWYRDLEGEASAELAAMRDGASFDEAKAVGEAIAAEVLAERREMVADRARRGKPVRIAPGDSPAMKVLGYQNTRVPVVFSDYVVIGSVASRRDEAHDGVSIFGKCFPLEESVPGAWEGTVAMVSDTQNVLASRFAIFRRGGNIPVEKIVPIGFVAGGMDVVDKLVAQAGGDALGNMPLAEIFCIDCGLGRGPPPKKEWVVRGEVEVRAEEEHLWAVKDRQNKAAPKMSHSKAPNKGSDAAK